MVFVFRYMTTVAEMYELKNLAEIFSNAMSICLIMFVRFFVSGLCVKKRLFSLLFSMNNQVVIIITD